MSFIVVRTKGPAQFVDSSQIRKLSLCYVKHTVLSRPHAQIPASTRVMSAWRISCTSVHSENGHKRLLEMHCEQPNLLSVLQDATADIHSAAW